MECTLSNLKLSVVYSLEFVCLLLFYATAIVFQLYHGGDIKQQMRRKPEPTLLLTQGNFQYHIGMV